MTKTSIQQFTRPVVREINSRIEAALKPLEEELGVRIRAVGGTFSSTNMQTKIEVATVGGDGQARTREAEDFERMTLLWPGLSPEDLGRMFTASGGRLFRIVGAKPRSKRYPILGERVSDGKLFKFPVETVAAGLADPKSS